MSLNKYTNTNLNVVPNSGGSVRVTIATNVGQGNGGTSLPCKKCWLVANATDVRVTIGTACTATTGIPVPWAMHDTTTDKTYSHASVLELEIDDVSSLYFYGSTDDAVVDILYRR